mgnify:CR=1 FL=1
MKRIAPVLLALSLSLLVTGCGFTLRGSQALPESLSEVYVMSPIAHAPLSRALKRRFDLHKVKEAATPEGESTVVIQLAPESLERRLLSVFPTGQVAEYELIYGVRYQVLFPGKGPVEAFFEVERDYQDDPDQVLAKTRELELVLKEMRLEAADRIIRRLPSQFATAVREE